MADRNLSLLIKFAALDKLTAPMRRLGAGSRALGASVAATKGELQALNATQARIAKFKALEERFGADARALAKERAEIDRLKKAIASTDGPTGNMVKGLANAEKAAAALERRMETSGTELASLGRKLGEANIDVVDLARGEERLAGSIHDTTRRLKDQTAQLERSAASRARFERTQQLGNKLSGAGAAAVATGVSVGAPLLASERSAADFQSKMTDIAQKVNLTRAAGTALGRQLDALGPKVAQLPAALAEGLDDLAGKGLDPRIAMRMLEPIGKAATAYKAEIADLSAAAFAANDNLKVPIAQTSKVLDIMAVAGKAGAFELKDMAQYFPALTAGAQALGQRGAPAVADLAAALEIARKGTGDSAAAATNIENLLNKINTKESIGNFKKFGVDLPAAMKKAAADGKTPMEAIAELTNKALGGDLSKLSFLFGDMQVQGALRPLIQNLALYRQIRADALRANGEVERDFAERMGDASAKSAHLAAVTQTLGHAVGNGLLPWVGAGMDKLAGMADRAAALAQRFPRVTAAVVTFAAAAASMLVTLGAMGLVGGQVVKGWGYLRFAAEKLNVLAWLPRLFGAVRFAALFLARGILQAGMLMLANPMVLAITLLVAAVGLAGYLIYRNWDRIKAAFSSGVAYLSSLAGRFKAMGAQLIEGLTGGIMAKIGAIKAAITGLGGKVIEWFRAKLGIHSPSRVFAGLGSFLSTGLANGIAASGGMAVRAMRGVAAGVTAAAAFGTVSPGTALATGIADNRGPAIRAMVGITSGVRRVAAPDAISPVDLARSIANGEGEAVNAMRSIVARIGAAAKLGSSAPAFDLSDSIAARRATAVSAMLGTARDVTSAARLGRIAPGADLTNGIGENGNAAVRAMLGVAADVRRAAVPMAVAPAADLASGIARSGGRAVNAMRSVVARVAAAADLGKVSLGADLASGIVDGGGGALRAMLSLASRVTAAGGGIGATSPRPAFGPGITEGRGATSAILDLATRATAAAPFRPVVTRDGQNDRAPHRAALALWNGRDLPVTPKASIVRAVAPVTPGRVTPQKDVSPSGAAQPQAPIALHYYAAPGDKDPRGDARRLLAEMDRIRSANARASYSDDD